jgi:hypothetical protein
MSAALTQPSHDPQAALDAAWFLGNMTTTTSITTSVWPDLDTPVVTDGGLETWLIFHLGVDLPAFAAYPLVDDERGRALLVDYYERYLAIAEAHDAAALLEAPTWRANPDWALTLGHDRDELGRFIDASIELMCDLRSRHAATATGSTPRWIPTRPPSTTVSRSPARWGRVPTSSAH